MPAHAQQPHCAVEYLKLKIGLLHKPGLCKDCFPLCTFPYLPLLATKSTNGIGVSVVALTTAEVGDGITPEIT